MNKFKDTIALLKEFFEKANIEFWLEAGTALGAYRDNKILPWDHDIDVAIWFNDLPIKNDFINFFGKRGYDVIFQKNFIYIDNIVQLKINEKNNNKLIDVDIYLYKEINEHAVMRWINSPVGIFSKSKQLILYKLNKIINLNNKNNLVHNLLIIFFKIYIYMYINTTYCYSHTFPKKYFKNLRKIKLYDLEVKVPHDIENFLEYRYGGGWKNKDKNYNQSGKWKKARARKKVLMNFIPMPDFKD